MKFINIENPEVELNLPNTYAAVSNYKLYKPSIQVMLSEKDLLNITLQHECINLLFVLILNSYLRYNILFIYTLMMFIFS